MRRFSLVFLLSALFAPMASADSDHDHAEHGVSAPLKLSEAALKRFGIGTQVLTDPSPAKLPKSAIVRSAGETWIYRKGKEGFERSELNALKTGDEIVVAGVSFLRGYEMSLDDSENEGHGH